MIDWYKKIEESADRRVIGINNTTAYVFKDNPHLAFLYCGDAGYDPIEIADVATRVWPGHKVRLYVGDWSEQFPEIEDEDLTFGTSCFTLLDCGERDDIPEITYR